MSRGAKRDSPGSGHLSDDQCLDLVHGLADARDRAEWSEHASHCPRCEALLTVHVDALERARSAGPRAARSGPARGAPAAAAGPVVPRGDHRWRTALGAIAATVLAVASVIAWNGRAREARWIRELPRLPASGEWIVVRGEAPQENAASVLPEALERYARGDDREVIGRLERERMNERLEPVRRIFLGSALAHRGRMNEARRALAGVPLDLLPEPWAGEVLWTHAVVAWSLGAKAESDSLLNLLTHRNPSALERVSALRLRLRGGDRP